MNWTKAAIDLEVCGFTIAQIAVIRGCVSPYAEWHDKPTGPGLWVMSSGVCHEATQVFEQGGGLHMLSRLCPVETYPDCKWFGPIPSPPKPEGGAT